MAFIDLETEFTPPPSPSPGPILSGAGTLDDPFFTSALPENITKMAQQARQQNQAVYWTFNGTKMRISPDATLHFAHNTPPLDLSIETEIRDALRQTLQS